MTKIPKPTRKQLMLKRDLLEARDLNTKAFALVFGENVKVTEDLVTDLLLKKEGTILKAGFGIWAVWGGITVEEYRKIYSVSHRKLFGKVKGSFSSFHEAIASFPEVLTVHHKAMFQGFLNKIFVTLNKLFKSQGMPKLQRVEQKDTLIEQTRKLQYAFFQFHSLLISLYKIQGKIDSELATLP